MENEMESPLRRPPLFGHCFGLGQARRAPAAAGNNGEQDRKRQLFLMPALPGSHVMGTPTAGARPSQSLEPLCTHGRHPLGMASSARWWLGSWAGRSIVAQMSPLQLHAMLVCRWSLCRDCVRSLSVDSSVLQSGRLRHRKLRRHVLRSIVPSRSKNPKAQAAIIRTVVAARDGSSSLHFLRCGSAFERPRVRAQTKDAQPATTLTHRKGQKSGAQVSTPQLCPPQHGSSDRCVIAALSMLCVRESVRTSFTKLVARPKANLETTSFDFVCATSEISPEPQARDC